MAYPAVQLITRALNLANIVSKDFETATGNQITNGLNLLNELLAFNSTDKDFIPYFKHLSFNYVVGQEEYYFENLLQVESLTFNIGTVRYPMAEVDRVKYFGTGRVDNINALPFMYHVERELGGSRVYVYYRPQQAYAGNLWGKFGLEQIASLSTDLELYYDKFYLGYLRYALAKYMADEYDITFSPQKMAKLKSLEKRLNLISPPDLTMQKSSFLGGGVNVSWAQVNIGQGWIPT